MQNKLPSPSQAPTHFAGFGVLQPYSFYRVPNFSLMCDLFCDKKFLFCMALCASPSHNPGSKTHPQQGLTASSF